MFKARLSFSRFLTLTSSGSTTRSAPQTKPYVGHDGLLEWYSDFRAHVGDFRFDPVELIDAGGDQVVTVHRVTATGITSGAQIEQTQAAVVTLPTARSCDLKASRPRPKLSKPPGCRSSSEVSIWTKSASHPRDTARAMSQENIDLVRSHYEAYNRQDLEATLAPLHDDIEIDLSATAIPETETSGTRPVAAVFTDQWKTSGAIEQRPQEFVELDEDHILVPLQCWGMIDGTELELWMELVDIWTLRDGKAARIDVYPDKGSALEAAGLSE